MIELTGHGDISCETVRQRLAENGLEPWRAVKIAGRRTNTDFAACMRDLVDIHCPDALLIRVVPDNLSTHSASALYDAFPASEARRMLRHLEFHHTPKHAKNSVAPGQTKRPNYRAATPSRAAPLRVPGSARPVRERSAWDRVSR